MNQTKENVPNAMKRHLIKWRNTSQGAYERLCKWNLYDEILPENSEVFSFFFFSFEMYLL